MSSQEDKRINSGMIYDQSPYTAFLTVLSDATRQNQIHAHICYKCTNMDTVRICFPFTGSLMKSKEQ